MKQVDDAVRLGGEVRPARGERVGADGCGGFPPAQVGQAEHAHAHVATLQELAASQEKVNSKHGVILYGFLPEVGWLPLFGVSRRAQDKRARAAGAPSARWNGSR
jgi:hypothetical protein